METTPMMDLKQIEYANANPKKWREETGRVKHQCTNGQHRRLAAQRLHGERVENRQRANANRG